MAEKLDYRCRGVVCPAPIACRRYMTGPGSKACPAPFAAFDSRRDGFFCDGLAPRIQAPIVVETEGGEL